MKHIFRFKTCVFSFRVWLVAGPPGPGRGRVLHVSLPRRQLPLPGRRCRPLPQPDLLHLPGLMMTQSQKLESLCFPNNNKMQHVWCTVWQQTIIITTYCIFKADVCFFLLVKNVPIRPFSSSTNKLKYPRGRAVWSNYK